MKLLVVLTMCAMSTCIYAQAIDSSGCTGAVGDVKFSMLEDGVFQTENGDCWVLLDGRSFNGERLAQLVAGDNIPDARGVFIRCYDNRQTDRIDVDRAFGEEIGSIQQDTFKAHFHYLQKREDNTGDGSNTDVGDIGHGFTTIATSVEGGSETRPKNLTMYTYIRIN